MTWKWLAALGLLMSVGAAPQAKPGEDKILSRFVGKWEAEGKHMKAPLKATAEYNWSLGKQFLKGDVHIASGDGKFVYDSALYFRPTDKEGQYSVVWLDSMGNIINSTMKASGSTLTMEWMEKTPLGDHPAKSEITLHDEGWTDRSFGKMNDAWVEFGSLTFKKK